MPKPKRSDITTQTVLQACELKGHTAVNLKNKTKAPTKVIYAALSRDYDSGLLEYGTALGACWLTEEGKKYLEGM